jgi:glycosyltransferase involved in cell wall biosynthesis
MRRMVKVSIVIPTYNDEATIAATVESALAQRFDSAFEVIVVNDGSTDGTRAALEKFATRIRVIEQENRGVAAARNAGIGAAGGEFIVFLDGDDTLSGSMLAKTVPLLDKNPKCVAVSTNGVEVDRAGRVINPNYVEPGCGHAPTLDEMLGRPWPILVGGIVIRRDTLVAIGGFSEEFRPGHWGGEDTFMYLLLRERGEFMYVPEPLVRHRVRDFRAHYANRMDHRRFEIDSAAEFADFERRFGGNIVLAKLVLDHFGLRGRGIAEWSINRVADELITVGLMAMHDGNRWFARRCYRASLRHRPLKWKTYFRLGWAMLPGKIPQTMFSVLAPRLLRSLAGPPFSQLSESPAASRKLCR